MKTLISSKVMGVFENKNKFSTIELRPLKTFFGSVIPV